MVIAIIFVLIALLIFSPQIKRIIDKFTFSKEEQDQEKADIEALKEKGIIATGLEFLIGTENLESPTRAATPAELSESFSDVAGIKITFDKSTVVDPITGIITADKPPTFSLSDEEKAALIKELGLTQQFELVDEKSVTAKRPKSIFLAA